MQSGIQRHKITIRHRMSDNGFPFSEVMIVYSLVADGIVRHASSRYRFQIPNNEDLQWNAFLSRQIQYGAN